MIWCICVIIFGLVNIIIYRMMKNCSIVKAKIIKRSYIRRRKNNLRNFKSFIIEYTFKDREYRSTIDIYPENPRYNNANIRR